MPYLDEEKREEIRKKLAPAKRLQYLFEELLVAFDELYEQLYKPVKKPDIWEEPE